VEWTTLIHRASGEKKVTDLSIDFYPAERPGIFASAMQTNVFGQSVPYDPVAKDADPYVWAGIDGNTLTVRALYIVDGGGYEMHYSPVWLNRCFFTIVVNTNKGDIVLKQYFLRLTFVTCAVDSHMIGHRGTANPFLLTVKT